MNRVIDQVCVFDLVMVDKSVIECFFCEEMGIKGSLREADNHKSCDEPTATRNVDHANMCKQKGSCLTGGAGSSNPNPDRPVLTLKRKDRMSSFQTQYLSLLTLLPQQ